MRALTTARALVASAALALLAPLVAAASLSPSLASDDPMQVDLLLNVTRPGAVTVVLWEDGYEGGVNGHPLALTLDAGAVDAASIAAAEDAAASLATNQLGAGVEPHAALLDEVTHDPVADAAVAAPCCAPNRTWHLRAPPPPPPPPSSTPPATAPTSGTPDRTLPTSRACSSPSSSAARTATSSLGLHPRTL